MTNQLDSNNENLGPEMGLSNYTKNLAQETRVILEKIIPTKEEEKNALEQVSEDQNRDFLRACTVFVLSQMNVEEKEALNSKEFDFKKIIQLAIDKAPMEDDIRATLESQVQSITEENSGSQTEINQKLFNDRDSIMSQFYKYLYESFHQNPEVDQAYISLII